ncbi:MAG: imidazole glycerol phosphate synthase subunit HisH [Ruminococcaceae bacterium]|nr:imidazole glycerol phosphate synthase subunit HisH [Oscillospiraceae bacterium]
MIAIIDYGVGNLFSLKSSFEKIGEKAIVTGDKDELLKADRVILPGVGAFGDAADKLKESGLFEFVKELSKTGKPIMGICLGMQLLFDKGYEYGEHEGLGLIKGEVRPISDVIPKGLKIPHIGWNALKFKKDSKIFKYLNDGDFVYFVHSFYGANCDDSVSAVSEYGAELTASVESGNVYGCQFHPEKSGDTGLKILKAFCEL